MLGTIATIIGLIAKLIADIWGGRRDRRRQDAAVAEAAGRKIAQDIEDESNERLAKAIRARRRAQRDWDDRVRDDTAGTDQG